MAVIDVQVRARNHPGGPWAGHLHGPQSATGEEMVRFAVLSRLEP